MTMKKTPSKKPAEAKQKKRVRPSAQKAPAPEPVGNMPELETALRNASELVAYAENVRTKIRQLVYCAANAPSDVWKSFELDVTGNLNNVSALSFSIFSDVKEFTERKRSEKRADK